jgi:KTSC domain-containing protein
MKMPEMIYVDSSNIEAIGYDDDKLELHVRFLAGGYYIYQDVPRQVFDGLMSAPSKGSFLNREVKGVYQFAKQ